MPVRTLAAANVVITANTFNLSIFNQLWLERHGIFTEGELTSAENVFLPVVVQVSAENCHLLIVPERLQMTLKTPDNPEPVLEKVRSIVHLLPETPYTAIGLNAIWNLSMDEGDSVSDFTRRNFAVPGHPLYDYFSDQDAKFGTYVSKPFGSFQLRGDIKPIIIVPTGTEMVQLSFNYNLDLQPGGDNIGAITGALAQWADAFQETQTIMGMLS